MPGRFAVLVAALITFILPGLGGCRQSKPYRFLHDDTDQKYYVGMATTIDFPDEVENGPPRAANTLRPRTVRDTDTPDYWPLKLQEAVKMALAQNKVLHDLGGRIVNSPTSVATIYDVGLQESNPLTGVEAALDAFDTNFSTSLFYENNDRALNNLLLGGGTRLFVQDRAPFQMQWSKTTATGGQVFFRNNTLYDKNNAPANLFPSYYDTNFEVEARQPLLQGGGVDFNRIVGPQSTNGYAVPTGVAIARLRADVSLTEFEEGVRTLVNDVENAYWDLYYAYRDLDAKIQTRDQALETWRAVNAQVESGAARGEADREAQAREQYFYYQQQVEDALGGSPRRQTQTGIGSGGGTFQGSGGVYAAERRLRFLLGLPVADGRLIRPADEPSTTLIIFDWDESLREALARRVELRRQKWLVKQAEFAVVAAKNYLLPRLDASALYRWRGFGNHLVSQTATPDEFNNAVQNLLSGQFQESQLGLQFNMPIGFRQGHAAVRNAQLQVAREKAILADQERQVATDLASAVAEVDRAYNAVRRTFDRRLAASQQAELIQQKFQNPPADRPVPIEFLLDAQRRRVDAEISYQRALIEYNLSLKNVHFEKGSLLDYNEISLSEGPWPAKAYRDADKRSRERAAARPFNYGFTRPGVVTHALFQQLTPKADAAVGEPVSPPPADAPPPEQLPPPANAAPAVPPAELLQPKLQ